MSQVNLDQTAMTPDIQNVQEENPRVKLGQILKKARITRELSYDDVIKATCIRQRIIQALEEGNFNHIGSETYVKGFIKTYAAFLGLVPDTLLALYEENPIKKKYVHPFDMAFPSPISMAPTRKLLFACAFALAFLLVGFTLYDPFSDRSEQKTDVALAKFTSYLEENDKIDNNKPLSVTLTPDENEIDSSPLSLTPVGDPQAMLKQVSKRYNLAQGAENIILEPQKVGWIELYQGDKLVLRTKLMPSSRYFLGKEQHQKLVVKQGNWLQASYQGLPLKMDPVAECNDYSCDMPQN